MQSTTNTTIKGPTVHTNERPPTLHINVAALEDLPELDQADFVKFGVGPSQNLPYMNLVEGFEVWAKRQPQTVAIEFGDRSLTYTELDRWSSMIAAEMQDRGVVRGDCVGVFMRRGPDLVASILAVLKTGAAYVPQDITISPASVLAHIVETTAAKVILTTSQHHRLVPSGGPLVIDVDQPLPNFDPQPVTVQPDDRCSVLFTSGTTGNPNGVQITHRNVCNVIHTKPGRLDIGPGVRVAQLLNIAFDMAAWEILGTVTNGGTLVIRSGPISDSATDVDVIIATPSVLASIDPANAPRVSQVAVAGEPCPRPLAEQWSRQAAFHNCCGPTETTIVNTAAVFFPSDADLTIGEPTPNNTVYILDDDRRPLPIGSVGEMWAGGDGVTAGYLDNPGLTADRYHPDPFLGGERMMFRTRDLGQWTRAGRLLHHGRTDDQVKVRGFRVELDSVSRALEATPGVDKAVTLKLDQRTLVAAVTPATADLAAAQASVEASLPYYCVPEFVLARPNLPVTPRGKVDKESLLVEIGGALSTSMLDLAVGGEQR